MASVTMSATFLSGAALSRRPSLAAPRRSLVISAKAGGMETVSEEKREGRREMVFAAAAAAVCSVASVAMAEPARGSKEAKKAYAPVCVTMPTARICHK